MNNLKRKRQVIVEAMTWAFSLLADVVGLVPALCVDAITNYRPSYLVGAAGVARDPDPNPDAQPDCATRRTIGRTHSARAADSD